MSAADVEEADIAVLRAAAGELGRPYRGEDRLSRRIEWYALDVFTSVGKAAAALRRVLAVVDPPADIDTGPLLRRLADPAPDPLVLNEDEEAAYHRFAAHVVERYGIYVWTSW
jgi:hypothetical protein